MNVFYFKAIDEVKPNLYCIKKGCVYYYSNGLRCWRRSAYGNDINNFLKMNIRNKTNNKAKYKRISKEDLFLEML